MKNIRFSKTPTVTTSHGRLLHKLAEVGLVGLLDVINIKVDVGQFEACGTEPNTQGCHSVVAEYAGPAVKVKIPMPARRGCCSSVFEVKEVVLVLIGEQLLIAESRGPFYDKANEYSVTLASDATIFTKYELLFPKWEAARDEFAKLSAQLAATQA